MKTKITLPLTVIILLMSFQFCSAQNIHKKISMEGMPAFVNELQQGPPPQEMMYREPALYKRLMQRRAVLSGILQSAVQKKQLPEEALQVLNTHLPEYGNNMSNEADRTAATNFHLTKDINTSTDANPYNYNYSYTPHFAVLNNVIYYAADDGIHGIELWRSDGTAAGTYLVKDINPGSASGNALYITVFKGKLYFTSFTTIYGWELRQSDGTSAGTILLKDIATGTASSSPSRFTVAGNYLYFTLDYYNGQLWRTNGTAGGTAMIADINSVYGANGIAQLTYANSLLFFTAYNYAYGAELWRSDGTSGGTYIVTDINPYNNNSYYYYDGPTNLTVYNSLLYFGVNSIYGRTLWQSDGTPGGTNIVPYSNGITLPGYTYYAQYQDLPFAIAKNSLFFAGYNYATGTELYKYNAVGTAGITLVKDISTGSVSSLLTTEGIQSMNDSIYFVIADFTGTKYNLWKSGGTAANTDIIKALPGPVYNGNFYAFSKNLYFSTSSSAYGNEPWISDGSAAGTKLLKDINTGTPGSSPFEFTSCNGKIYFSASTPSGGRELWNTNGTSGGTIQIKDANTTTTASSVTSYNYSMRNAIPLDNNKLLFNAYKTSTGYELWKSDGTAAGTALIQDLANGEYSSNPQFYDSKNGKVYFGAYDNALATECVYVTDGTVPGTKRIAITNSGYIYNLKVADNGIVFYTNYNNGYGLWRTDSSGNYYQLYSSSSYFSDMNTAGNLCYFGGNNGYGTELWKSDGTKAGTNLIADINPGSGYSNPSSFVPLGNKILFIAYNGYGSYLWASNGTTLGTVLLSNTIYPYLYNHALMNGKLYFEGYESAVGYELYSTDGTAAGTGLLKDIYAGTLSSNPYYFTTVNSTVFFEANDGIKGNELWKTNGTAGGTKIVKDLTPGSDGSYYLSNFTSAGGKLYFTDSSLLWVSEGTAADTKKISDPGLANVTSIAYLVGTGNKLFISGNSYAYGYELYEGDATLSAAKFKTNPVAKAVNTSGLIASIVTNPVINDLKININSPINQQLKINVSNAGGQQFINKAIRVNAGINFITLNAAQWLPGFYMINISSNTGAIDLKAVK